MYRTYDAQALVDLPRLDAAAAVTIGMSLVSAAAAQTELAANIVAAQKQLSAGVAELQAAQVAGLTPAAEPDLAPALRTEAAAWAGMEAFLKAMSVMVGTPQALVAERLLAALFPDGLLFVRTATAKRWSATQARIVLIDQHGFAADFETLGGAALLQHLRAAHVATGAAAGITAVKTPVESPKLRARFDGLKQALRTYVLQVVANAALEPTEANLALAGKLLAPLAQYVPPEVSKAAAVVAPAVAAEASA